MCDPYCNAVEGNPFFMGGIHPRLKHPVGQRLASAAFSLVYGSKGAVAGPTIRGCDYENDGNKNKATLTIKFSALQLGNEQMIVQDYNRSTVLAPFGGMSALQVGWSVLCCAVVCELVLFGRAYLVPARLCIFEYSRRRWFWGENCELGTWHLLGSAANNAKGDLFAKGF